MYNINGSKINKKKLGYKLVKSHLKKPVNNLDLTVCECRSQILWANVICSDDVVTIVLASCNSPSAVWC